ncbi:MAG: RNA-binding domain-containing protein [Candidatus Hydrothermarchaeota archaeon]
MPVRKIVGRISCHATEDERRIKDSIRFLLTEKAKVKEFTLLGHHGNPIKVFEASLSDEETIKSVISRLKDGLREDIHTLRDSFSERIENNVYFLRLDKQELVKGGYKLANDGESIQLKIFIKSKERFSTEMFGGI